MSKTQSQVTDTSLQEEYIDVLVEGVYEGNRRYGYCVSDNKGIRSMNFYDADDTDSRHTLTRRATRESVESIPSCSEFVIRCPTRLWQQTSLALGNMRDRNLDVELRKEQTTTYEFAKRFLQHEGANGMTTALGEPLPDKVNLYIDASKKHSDSYGYVITDSSDSEIYRIGGGEIEYTARSTHMEVLGITKGLKSIPKSAPVSEVNTYCDCAFAVRKFNQKNQQGFGKFGQEVVRARMHHTRRDLTVNKIDREYNPADIPARVLPKLRLDRL